MSLKLRQELEAQAAAEEPSEEFGGDNTTAFNEEILAPQVEEMLVSAGGRDVLYEWQCPQREARIAFMDVLASETQKLSPLLGKFERFDLITPKDHLLVRVQPDHRIFLRACSPPTSVQ
jgi:hypothetical protein